MQIIMDILSFFKHWVTQVFMVIFFSLCLDLIQKRILVRIIEKLRKTKIFWDHVTFEAAQLPLTFLIWIFGISVAAQIIEKQTGALAFSVISILRHIGTIFVISWFCIRWVRGVEQNLLELGKRDKTTIDALGKVLKASIIITGGLVTLQALGLSLSGVLAFGGIGGIAIGFAAKDMLANFFGAFMLYWDRPFKVGEWIRSPDREIEGTVEHIGWRLTCIRTFDKRPLYVPNAVFSTISVENPSRMSNRRIYETIGLRYEDASQVPAVLADVRKVLYEHPEIDTEQTLMVNLLTFGASSIDFFIYTFTKTTEWTRFHEIQEDVLLKIHQIILAHGAEIAFPETRVHLLHEDQKVLQQPEQISTWKNPVKNSV